MDSRVVKIIEVFKQAGWKLNGSVDIKADWWFENILHLVSEWHPVGVSLYLTLLTDPMSTQRKVVSAVTFSSSLPEQNNYKSIRQISLNDVKKTNLTELVKEINSIVLKG